MPHDWRLAAGVARGSHGEWINTVPSGWLSEMTTGELGRRREGTEQK